MAETLLFVSIGTLLIVGAATFVVVALILRNARKSTGVAEDHDHMKYLGEEQGRLAFLREERENLKEELRQEREQHLEATRRAERFKQERLLLQQDQGQLVEELEQEHEKYLEARRQAERLNQKHLLLQQERNQLADELNRERKQHLEAQGRAERFRQESLLLRQEQGQLAKELERLRNLEVEQRALQEQEGWERRARQEAERRADRLGRELQELREVEQNWEVQQRNSLPVLEGFSENLLETREPLKERPLPRQIAQETVTTRRPATSLEPRTSETTSSMKPAEGPPEDKRPRLGMWHPHPDDSAVSRGKASFGWAQDQSGASIKTDHKHYDKYLENYQGYVELAEKLYQTRDSGKVPPGSPTEREWEKRLRRVNDGIDRTTARLDILEEYNPELATDERISHRAGIARRQAKLQR